MEGKRPYYRYALARNDIRLDLDLKQLEKAELTDDVSAEIPDLINDLISFGIIETK